MAVGNTFGATALSSYGGFWIAFGIILTPGGFGIVEAEGSEFADAFGLFLMVFSPLLFFQLTKQTSLMKIFPGLVHLHLPPTHVHPSLHRRLFLSLSFSSHEIFSSVLLANASLFTLYQCTLGANRHPAQPEPQAHAV